MKKKIAILGSTGSIGDNTLKIFKKDIKNFEIILLTTNKNYKKLLRQAKIFKVKNVIIYNYDCYKKFKKLNRKKYLKIFHNTRDFIKHNTKKIDYTMCAISGISGLAPTLELIKHSRKIAIANKESIICAWNLIQKRLKSFKTNFVPVDSEHFSIWMLNNGSNYKNIEKIYITASGGPFLNYSKKKFNSITPLKAAKHPNWKMGKKISIDSSTLMNKVFEVIEAQRIFDIDKSKFKILTHPESYVHSLIKYNNGVTKVLVHDTNMTIPIFNSIYDTDDKKILKTNSLNIKKMNNLNFKEVDIKRFPLIKIINKIPKKISLFETVLISANDTLVEMFLNQKIKYLDIQKILVYILDLPEFSKYKQISPKNLKDIINLNKRVRLKIQALSVISTRKWKF